MKSFFLVFGIVFLFSCNSNNEENTANATGLGSNYITHDIDNQPDKDIENSSSLIKSIKDKIPLITASEFKLTAQSDDNIDGKLIKLDQTQVDYFYNNEELKEVYEYYHFSSYYYGKLKDIDGKTPILILNSNYETAIYLDCFLIDSVGKITGMFRPSYIELEVLYSYQGRGKFVNNTYYKQTAISYTTIDEENNISQKDSMIIDYQIEKSGLISKKEIYSQSDTIKID